MLQHQTQEQTLRTAPLNGPSQQQVKAPLESAASAYHVLVVHHTQSMLNLMAEMFQKLDYQVTKATTSAKALLYFGRKPCDLLFTDLEMPMLDGYRLARHFKNHTPSTKAMVMTGYCQAELAGQMMDGTVDGWLYKPFKLETFRNTLSQIEMYPAIRNFKPHAL